MRQHNPKARAALRRFQRNGRIRGELARALWELRHLRAFIDALPASDHDMIARYNKAAAAARLATALLDVAKEDRRELRDRLAAALWEARKVKRLQDENDALHGALAHEIGQREAMRKALATSREELAQLRDHLDGINEGTRDLIDERNALKRQLLARGDGPWHDEQGRALGEQNESLSALMKRIQTLWPTRHGDPGSS